MLQSERVLKRALDLDDTFMPAWSLLIGTYFRGAAVGAWHPLEAYSMVQTTAEQILETDKNNVVAIIALADVAAQLDYDYETARVYLERATVLAPDNQRLRERFVSLPDKNFDRTTFVSFFEDRVVNDPAEVGSLYRLGQAYYMSRRFDQAEGAFRRTISLSPSSSGSHFYLGAILLLGENYEAALAQMDLEVRDGYAKTGRVLVFHSTGNTDQAATELADLIDIGYRWTYQIAGVYAFMDNIRDDPRFLEILRTIGRAE